MRVLRGEGASSRQHPVMSRASPLDRGRNRDPERLSDPNPGHLCSALIPLLNEYTYWDFSVPSSSWDRRRDEPEVPAREEPMA